jgi:UDP-N-acetylglucosamine/UDP-N-acetylgalactosamine diphosphorylase
LDFGPSRSSDFSYWLAAPGPREAIGTIMNDSLQQQLVAAGQEHLLEVLEQLASPVREQLEAQLRELDLDLIARLVRDEHDAPDWEALARRATPPTAFRLNGKGAPFGREQARERGVAALRAGQVAALLVAGGQGSRLGFEHPKGMFPIGPVSDHSLFQILIERVLATARRYDTSVPLLVMTSPATHAETVQYLDQNDRFGLPADDRWHLHRTAMAGCSPRCTKVGRLIRRGIAVSNSFRTARSTILCFNSASPN